MSGHPGARVAGTRRGATFGHPLPADALAKLQRLLRTRGYAPTSTLLRVAGATIDNAIIGNLQVSTRDKLIAALAEVP